MLEKILSLHRIYKQLIVILYDLTISFFSIFLGYLFVSNFNDLNFQENLNLTFISVVCFISIFLKEPISLTPPLTNRAFEMVVSELTV
mgnify:CR=1 FL=1